MGVVIHSQHEPAQVLRRFPTGDLMGWSFVPKTGDMRIDDLVAVLRSSARGMSSGTDASSEGGTEVIALLREVFAFHHGLADFAFVMQGLGSGPIVLAGMSSTTVLVLALTLISDATVFVVAISILGFCMYAMRPVIHSWLMDRTPPALAATMTSAMFGTQSTLTAITPPMAAEPQTIELEPRRTSMRSTPPAWCGCSWGWKASTRRASRRPTSGRTRSPNIARCCWPGRARAY